MTKILSRDDLLSGQLLKRELTFIEDWDASIWLRELSGDVIREYRKRIKVFQDTGVTDIPDDQAADMMTYILANSICDETGVLQFTEEEAKALTVNSLNTLIDIVNKIFAVSGVKTNDNGEIVSEVADDLPNDLMISLSSDLHKNSTKRKRKRKNYPLPSL